ncbi:hypothetical protein BK139_12980 [Paenibacillus sp. FSL R5-0490]|uniref:hypothetical protein n=1 Tax=Paenibacillus sp. FSL R5-0490 TaxID=1920424 RepID=UPI00096BE4B9|nr:hypothetical protein [Paenibacillus sp. FSL R5-0490]OMF59314.1 hypothetical protein BK139_12980 [Paenibacillus sp. FSL R5-0490]
MRKYMGAIILALFALTSCSEGTGKSGDENEKKEQNETLEETVNKDASGPKGNEGKVEAAKEEEYSFKEFVKLSEQQQRETIIPMVNKLGYKDELGLKLLTFINEEDSDLAEYYKTINEYVTYYIENSSMPSLQLETSIDDKGYQLPEGVNLTEEIINKRIAAVKGKPLFEITETDQLTILGIGMGDSYEGVAEKLGEPDHVNRIKQSGVTHNEYHFHIPGNTLADGLNRYQIILRYEDNGETPDAISKIKLIVDNKDDIKPSVELPSEFTARFSGETYIHSPVNKHGDGSAVSLEGKLCGEKSLQGFSFYLCLTYINFGWLPLINLHEPLSERRKRGNRDGVTVPVNQTI